MDNPAVTAPAVYRLDERVRNDGNPVAASNGSLADGISKTAPLAPSKYNQGWRRIVRNFSPSWFSVTMGTGAVSVFLVSIPWKADWLHYLGIVFFVLNAVLFSAGFVISVLRYTIWPEIWTVMIEDPTNSLFLATIPMGFATLVEMWVAVCVPAWGDWASYTAWALWMLDSILAVGVTVSLPVLLMSDSHQRSLDTITAAQLLPIAATIVAAGTGSNVAGILSDPQYALGTIITSYVLWAMAMPMAVCVLVMYYQRLALHKMPPREVIVAAVVFPQTDTIDPLAGRLAFVLGFFVALSLWSWGLIWLCFAIAALYKTAADVGVPFNMGWWGFTFPLGVYAISTIQIGEEMPSLFFRVLGTILGTCVIVLWIVNACGTAKGAWSGALFQAPCLQHLQPHHQTPATYKDDAEKEKSANAGS